MRLAGDGLIVAAALGSSACSMAVGPVMEVGTRAFVCTLLAMSGRTAPPPVIAARAKPIVDVSPANVGFDMEIDDHRARESGNRSEVALQNAKATLVSFGAPGHGIAVLRRRRLVADSPRILARDDRGAYLAAVVEPPR